jgi:hypothetical protein
MKKQVRRAVPPGSEFLAFKDSLKEDRIAEKVAEIGIDRDGIGVGRECRHAVRLLLQSGGFADAGFAQKDERLAVLERRQLRRAWRSSEVLRRVAQKAGIRKIHGAVPRPEARPGVVQIRPMLGRGACTILHHAATLTPGRSVGPGPHRRGTGLEKLRRINATCAR